MLVGQCDDSDILAMNSVSLVMSDLTIEAKREKCEHLGEESFGWSGTAKDAFSGKEHHFNGISDQRWAAIMFLIFWNESVAVDEVVLRGMYALAEQEMREGNWPVECRPFP